VTPPARLQAAAEILDEVIAAARSDGPPADAIVTRYFKTRRYAGSGDRRAVRELVFRAIRRAAERPTSGRAAILGLRDDVPELEDQFGAARGPLPIEMGEEEARPGFVPGWLASELSPLVAQDEWPALLDRAPVDLRVNAARNGRDALLHEFPTAVPTKISPWGLRLPADSRVDDHPSFAAGLVEVQDEGSQLIALASVGQPGQRILDLCAGAGGKALAIAAACPGAEILATDTNRARLAKLPPRAERAGAVIATRLLDGGRESDALAEMAASFDVVLVDAPCSGSGTWRRNPEGRWRLTPDRLDRLVELQARLLEIGSAMVRPGGRLVYAVCSLLSREGAGQAERFLQSRSSWVADEIAIDAGRAHGDGRVLTPGHDGTDGFFVARFVSP
jgi:16S rRNA (cytosine967-C5)-methyltransferase